MTKIVLIGAAILAAGFALMLFVGKPAGPNNCKSGDTACDYTKG